jgi:hypothetical protein
MLIEDGLVVLNESKDFLNSFVGIVFGEQCYFAQKLVVVHDDMNDTPMLDVIGLVLDGILGDLHSLDTIVDILTDILFEIGMGKRTLAMSIFIEWLINNNSCLCLNKGAYVKDKVLVSTQTRIILNMVVSEHLALVKLGPALRIDFVFREEMDEPFFVVQNILLVGAVEM